MVRVTVLGGAAACPNPGQGCSAYLLDTAGQRILLDCGADTLATLQQYARLDALDGVLISHLHADHVLDLVPLRYGLKYMPGLVRRPLPLWMPPGGRVFLAGLASALARGEEGAEGFFDEVFVIAEYAPDDQLQLGEFRIRFQPTHHYIPCWAFRIEVEGRVIVYLADTGPDPNLVPFSERADLLICEATFREAPVEHRPGTRGHLTAREAGELAAAAGVRRLVLTHYWASLRVDELRHQAEDAFGQPVEVATPGLTLVIE